MFFRLHSHEKTDKHRTVYRVCLYLSEKNNFSTVYMHKYLWKNTQTLDYIDYMGEQNNMRVLGWERDILLFTLWTISKLSSI